MSKTKQQPDASALRSWEVIRRCVEESGKSVVEIAAQMRNPEIRLRVTSTAVEEWTSEPDAPHDADFLQRASILVTKTKCSLPLQWVCAQLGGFFAFDSKAFSKGSSLLPDWYEVTKEIHQLRAAIVDAYRSDRTFDVAETRGIGRAWADVLAWVEGFTCWSEHRSQRRAMSLQLASTDILPFVSSHDALHHAYSKDQKFGAKALVDSVGVSLSLLQKWGEHPGSTTDPKAGAANPLDYIVHFCRATGSAVAAEWICASCGGFIVEHESCAEGHGRDLVSSWQQVHRELAELDCVITTAAQDDRIDKAESESIRAEWEDVKEWMRCFVPMCRSQAKP